MCIIFQYRKCLGNLALAEEIRAPDQNVRDFYNATEFLSCK